MSDAEMYNPIRCAAPSTSLPMWALQSEWNDPPIDGKPYCNGNWVKMPLPADASPALKRRSEVRYSNSGTYEDAYYAVGMTTGFEGWVQPRLGAASLNPNTFPEGSFEQKQQKRQWHCLAQLHGAQYDGSFIGAIAALSVEQGMWMVQHGTREWQHPIVPYVDGKAVFVKMYVTLSEDPAVGRVFGQIGNLTDGTGAKFDFRHKTWSHQWAIWMHGIYRGSGADPYEVAQNQPTYYQENNWSLTKITPGAPMSRRDPWPEPTYPIPGTY